MRKLTAISFALLIATSAVAAPNDSSDRNRINPITRIVRIVKNIIRTLEQPGVPLPTTTN